MPHALVLAMLVVAYGDPPQRPSPADVVGALETAMADAIAKAEPSVMAIARFKSEDGEETLAVRGGTPRPTTREERFIDSRLRGGVTDDDDEFLMSNDYGSGVVIGEGGQILTAYHVVKGASRLLVRAPRPQKMFEAEIIAADPRSDLAVLMPVEDTRPQPVLKPLPLGDASRLRKGSFLVALGNPFNVAHDGTASASWGILSNTARRLVLSDEEKLSTSKRQLRNYPTLLQLDAKLNLGMSGGAVVNLKGELVGITSTLTSAAGFDAQAGYAIPIDPLTRRAIDALKQGKEVEYGFIGIRLDRNVPNRIGQVEIGTPAEQAGLLQKDTIIAVGDVPVTDGDSLILAVNAAPVGEPVQLRVLRDDREIEKTVVLSKMPVEDVIATNRTAPWRGLRVDYSSTLTFGTFSDDVLQAMARGHVGITEVVTGSPADKAGLRRGQVITRVDGQPVSSPREFARAVAGRKGPVTLTTDRGPISITPALAPAGSER